MTFYNNATVSISELVLPAFYRVMLDVWMATRIFLLKENVSRRNEIIYNNRFVFIDGHVPFDEGLFNTNVYKLHHIVDKEGNIKSNEEFQRKGLNSLEMSKIQRIFLGIPPSW